MVNEISAQDYPSVQPRSKIDLFEKIVYKNRQFRPKRNRAAIRKAIRDLSPDIFTKLDYFSEQTGKNDEDYEGRLFEIIMALNKFRPGRIIEIGSGRSSLAFAAWSQKYNASYIAYEQLDFWAEIGNEAIKVFAGDGNIQHHKVNDIPGLGGRFEPDIPADTDFLYIDGPTLQKPADAVTYTGKSAYSDAADFLRKGGRPKIIMVEGRTASVDLTLMEAQRLNLDFKFHPGFEWSVQRKHYCNALMCRRHSYFIFQ